MMFELHLLSGQKAGQCERVRRFPFKIGRSSQNDLSLTDRGVWKEHLNLKAIPGKGVWVEACEGAQTRLRVNGASHESCSIKSGDILELGEVRIEIRMSPPQLRNFIGTEIGFWSIVVGVCLSQLAMIYFWLQ